ncbi:helix-turn-helix transcriptional regulator [Streptomyces sp. NBC_00690]|uniref:helix-turn-helix transcriptional regulator n=1 Tax=Streptomyces sp. NBC_00690 TaxID=2975808 RepID=UPI002E2B72EA|nr:LuxR C-terminal-related transcriptional regulator [Streptomyces sp. NBC_00690]
MSELLFERAGALAAAARGASSARSGRGRWLLLRGETGSGRSALLEEIVRRETTEGTLRLLRARAAPEESRFAYATIRQLLPPYGPLPFDAPEEAEEQRILHRFMDGLATDAARRPVLLAVDGLDFVDGPSRRWLCHLTRRLADVPALLVLTGTGASAGPGGGRIPGDGGRLCETTGEEIPLPSLGSDSLIQLLAARGVSEEAADWYAAMSTGNPMLLHALLADLPEGALPHSPAGFPGPRFRDALPQWLNSSDTPARHPLALAMALAGTRRASDPALLHEVAGLPPDERAEARLVTPMLRMLGHPAAREAVIGAADPAVREVFRRRLAHALYERGVPAPEIADHLLRLGRIDEKWMTHALEDAAEQALHSGHTERAARLLQRALSGPVGPAGHSEICLRLAALETLRSTEAGIRRLHGGLQRADCHDPYAIASALSGVLAAQGRTRTAIRVMEEAGGRLADQRLSVAVRITVAGISNHEGREWHSTATEMRTLLNTAPSTVEPPVYALVTLHEAGTGKLDAATTVARITSRISTPIEPELRAGWRIAAASLLEWADHLDEARSLVEQELPPPPEPPDFTHIGTQYLLTTRATVDLRRGHFQRLISENTPLMEAARSRAVQLPYLHAMVALAWHELGHGEKAQQQLTALGPEPASASWGWEEVRWARARMHASAGRWAEALDNYQECGARLTARGFVIPVSQPWRSGAAIALARLGRYTEAVALAEENLRYAHVWGTPRVIGVALRALAVATGGTRGLGLLTEAVESLRAAPAVVELIEALADLGRAQAAAGQHRKARTSLREAMHLAQRLAPESPRAALCAEPRVPRLVADIGHDLRSAGTRKGHDDGACCDRLSAAERRVVDLAVQGLTNSQIGAALELARRTVESHLTSAYRKLRVSRRTQLAARLTIPPP